MRNDLGISAESRRVLFQAYEEFPNALNDAECRLLARAADVGEAVVDMYCMSYSMTFFSKLN